MPWIQRIALALLAFGFIGLGLIVWQPSSLATTSNDRSAFDLAISAGSGLRLTQRDTPTAPDPALLSCDKVLNLGGLTIGARCNSHGRELSFKD